MNLFNVNPQRLFEVVAAIILVVLASAFSIYFYLEYKGIDVNERYFGKKSTSGRLEDKFQKGQPPSTSKNTVKTGQDIGFVDYKSFGPVQVVLDAPSSARSNFSINPDTDIEIYFNRKVEYASLSSRLNVTSKETNEVVPFSMSLVDRDDSDEDIVGAKKWEEVWVQKAVLTSEVPLLPNKSYKISISSGYRTEDRTEHAQKAFTFSFMTASDPGLNYSKVDEGSPAKVLFNSPMLAEDIKDYATISPEKNELTFSVYDKTLLIEGMEAGVEYRVNIPADTPDIYGRELGEEINLVFSLPLE